MTRCWLSMMLMSRDTVPVFAGMASTMRAMICACRSVGDVTPPSQFCTVRVDTPTISPSSACVMPSCSRAALTSIAAPPSLKQTDEAVYLVILFAELFAEHIEASVYGVRINVFYIAANVRTVTEGHICAFGIY